MSKLPPPPPHIQRAIADHRTWLLSSGHRGQRFSLLRNELSEMRLDGVDLSLSFLAGGRLHGSSLRRAWLIGADLEDWHRSYLTRAWPEMS